MENTPISVRLSDENRAWLVRKADEEDRSLNNMINRIIEAAREADKRKDRK
jgi:predicted HicB family RNase H-like nuclease